MKIPIFDLNRQYQNLQAELDTALHDVIDRSAYINGKENERFDREFARYCEAKHAIGVSSGSSALTLALKALGVKKGDEVICPSHTFAATAEAIVHCQAKPVFVDIVEETYNIDPTLVEEAITEATKVIIVVHLYGQPADMDSILTLADKYNLKIVEDAAQAHGAKFNDVRVGGLADVACFSFFPAKNLGCFGDGGAVVTNDDEIAEKVRLLKDHGRTSKYHHEIVGYGERLDNLQAAVLLQKLPHLDTWNQRRREIAKYYTDHLSSMYIKPYVREDSESVFYVYTLRHQKREKIMNVLLEKGIATGIYYPEPLHLQPAFSQLGFGKGDFPITERIANEIFSIPVFPELTDEEIENIVLVMNEIANV